MEDLMLKRVYFISNRIVLSQVIFLLCTAIITSFLILADIASIIIPYWYVYLLILPGILIIVTLIKRKWLHFQKNWLITLIPLGLIWFSITVYVGVLIDHNLGIGKTLTISMGLLVMYLIGYALARFIRRENFYSRFKKKFKIGTDRFRKNLFWLGFAFSLMLITFTLITGWILLENTLEMNSIESIYSEDYGTFLSCLPCALSALYMFSGVLIVVFWILNYLTLSGLLDLDNASVEEDTPSKLIMIFLRNSMIVVIICWILAEFLVPPIMGGGGKGGGRSSRIRSSHRSSSSSDQPKLYSKFKDFQDQNAAKDKIWGKHNLL